MMDYLALNSMGVGELAVRVILSAFFGLALGIDREVKNKPIDFRVYMIIAVASCLIGIISMEMPGSFPLEDDRMIFDPTRVIQGVLVGIGFLGTGVIFQRTAQTEVIGTATAATIWAAAAIGLAIGFGFYAVALMGFAAVFLTLVVMGWVMTVLCARPDKLPKVCGDDEQAG